MKIQPAAVQSGEPFTVQPVIHVADASGNLVTNGDSYVIVATVISGPGTLQGAREVTTRGGVASFGDLGIIGDPEEYRVAFQADGLLPDTSVTFPLVPSNERVVLVGVDGASVALGDGAILVVPGGAIEGSLTLEFADSAGVTPEFEPLSDRGYNLAVSAVDPGTTFLSGDSVRIRVPMNRSVAEGATPYFRAVFPPIPNRSFFARPVSIEGAQGALNIPITALGELFSLLGGRVLLQMEDRESSPTGLGPSGIRGEELPGTTETVGCHDYPLRLDSSSKVPQPGDVAVVLVHGWHLSVEDCLTFEAFQRVGAGIPGEDYFATLGQILNSQIGDQHPIFFFTYPTFYHYDVAGDSLAQRLRTLLDEEGFAGFIVIGHSMGGLVARTAAAVLESDSDYAGSLRGIITLGTPHLGSPFALMRFLGAFYLIALDKSGGQSLRPEAAPSSQEEVPIFAYGGNMASRVFPQDNSLSEYIIFYAVLCAEFLQCDSDGVVPLESAVPPFIMRGRQGPVFEYAHPELHEGFRREGNAADPIYESIASDIRSLASNGNADPDLLIAYYPLDGDARDDSGNGHDGVVDSPSETSDRAGNDGGALLFDGLDDYIKLPYDPSFYPTSLGLSVWVRLEGSVTDDQVVLTANGAGQSPPYDPYGITITGGNTVTVVLEGNNPPGPPAEQIILTGSLSEEAGWHHVAASYDGASGDAHLWLDGVLVHQVSEEIVLGTNTLGLMLGARQDPDGQPFGLGLAGALDDVRVYGRSLTPDDVQVLCDVPSICQAETVDEVEVRNDDGSAEAQVSWIDHGDGLAVLTETAPGGDFAYSFFQGYDPQDPPADRELGFGSSFEFPGYPFHVTVVRIHMDGMNTVDQGLFLHLVDEQGAELLPTPFVVPKQVLQDPAGLRQQQQHDREPSATTKKPGPAPSAQARSISL